MGVTQNAKGDFQGQSILPAVRKMKDMERLLDTPYTWIVLLDSHISQLMSIAQLARSHRKQLLIHVDLIQGLKNDDYAIEFLCQSVRPAGIISTRSSAVATAKKHGSLAIQRHFLLDSGALEMCYKLAEKIRPDYIEVMPGVMPHIISELRQRLEVPILAGGLIRSEQDVNLALESGAIAVTTSRKELWDAFAPAAPAAPAPRGGV
ncbi:glycerol-3-phosphate responsive antiterminator [Paenibacillus sp. GD4]|jgi:glycerol uptake operon antiterminator|uniref:glycerol-3-phosphate responsive antiterminator n=1 Tax=Paenibacillus sp. GD4 TaxID=3068890 RepID=UPI00279654EC|nr:glycerol-3-phosphate responsive antiterminator [Paenibacillus sp. GD4]MDQ1912336.1 glycerol-3-phosphate responsive antiterminator [Paenibacillus sp. GD4]